MRKLLIGLVAAVAVVAVGFAVAPQASADGGYVSVGVGSGYSYPSGGYYYPSSYYYPSYSYPSYSYPSYGSYGYYPSSYYYPSYSSYYAPRYYYPSYGYGGYNSGVSLGFGYRWR